MSRPRLSNNRKFILHILFSALALFGAAVFPCLVMALAAHEEIVYLPMIGVCFGSVAVGVSGQRMISSTIHQVRPRICYMTTLFTWLFLILITVIPFYYGMPGYSPVDALLESTASWTTTGINVYDESVMPLSLMLLRAVCNWLGGVGIILVTLSVISSRKFIGWNLASTEFPGPTFLKSDPPFRTEYRKMVLIYGLFTAVQFALLRIAGMETFTAVLTAMSGSSTSGLPHLRGAAMSLTVPVKVIITVFTLLGSVNGSVFLLALRRRFRDIVKNSEIRFFLGRIVVTSLLITFIIGSGSAGRNYPRELGGIVMQVISYFSTSGYVITDFSRWPEVCAILILMQMFIGSCSLSTGGGIKDARLIIAFKTVSISVYKNIHPHSVRSLTFNKRPMKSDYFMRANLFISLFMITYLIGALLLSASDMSVAEALNYSQAMITNTGASIGVADAPVFAERFGAFSKLVMCLMMVAGRLEIYPLLMILFRNFWKSDASV